VADDIGGTWFITLGGIFRVSSQQLDRAFLDPSLRLDHQIFYSWDDLPSATFFDQWGGSAERGPDGRLWILTSSVLVWVDPHRLYQNHVPPPVSIEALAADGHVFVGAAAQKLAEGTSNIQIDYTALSLQRPERVRFRYQLDGVDNTWVDAGTRRQAFLS